MGRVSIFGSPISGALALAFSTLGALPLAAQTMPFPMGIREAVGVERGSTALIGPVDRDTYFLTFDTFGSEDIGPSILSAAAALPNIIASRDQLDAVAVLGGPVETGRQELLAGGLG